MVRILVDSSSDYTVAEIREKNLDLIPISITIGEQSYVDGYDLGRDEFYEVLQKSDDFPKTSQPSPQAFLDLFEEVRDAGDELVYIALSSALSGTYQTAVLAKNMTGYENIHIVDSLSATYTIKVMADYACRLRSEGMDAAGIAQAVEQLKSRVKVLAAPDTLEFLGRGGRISKAAATIGDLANLKPIITVTEDGQVTVIGKCLGKNKAIAAILRHLDEYGTDPAYPVYTIYSYGTENCAVFEEKLHREGHRTDGRLQIGSTIGTHIGPGAFGIIFVAKAK